MVVIHPPLVPFLTRDRADALVDEGLFADDLDGIRAAYAAISGRWDGIVDEARRLDASQLDQRVGGEWSFVETLRHLVFVTDVWVADVIEEVPSPNHPWGMPPDFLPPEAVSAMGLTVDARPTLDEVLARRDDGRERVGRVLSQLTPEGLDRTCVPRDGQFQVVGALQVVLFEEWAHLQYATRDLSSLAQMDR